MHESDVESNELTRSIRLLQNCEPLKDSEAKQIDVHTIVVDREQGDTIQIGYRLPSENTNLANTGDEPSLDYLDVLVMKSEQICRPVNQDILQEVWKHIETRQLSMAPMRTVTIISRFASRSTGTQSTCYS